MVKVLDYDYPRLCKHQEIAGSSPARVAFFILQGQLPHGAETSTIDHRRTGPGYRARQQRNNR